MTDIRTVLPRDFNGYGASPPNPEWPEGARIAVNIVVNVEEGAEPSVPDGDASSEAGLTEGGSGAFTGRDLGAESMFEYGSRVGFWRLLRVLRRYSAPSTFFACSQALERTPEIAAAIREGVISGQNDVCAHGLRWERHQTMDRDTERHAIHSAFDSLTRLTGIPPVGWYCRYAPTQNTRELLVEHGGFLYDSDAYNDELPYWTAIRDKQHLVVPYTQLTNDTKFFRGGISTGRQFFDFLKESFDMLYAEGAVQPKMMSIGLHTRIMGHPGRAGGLALFLEHMAAHPDVWLCRRLDLAQHWRQRHPAPSIST
jgi:allantoinase